MTRHVIGTKQYNRQQLEEIMAQAAVMEQVAKTGGCQLLAGKIMASLFFEPSTRTRFSFEAAMARLGGQVISTENAAQFSSMIKGETLEDSIRVISSYADVIVMRHYEVGAAARAAAVSQVPILNAGDGAGEHPTQALLDLYTIQKELGTVDGISIAMVGDLAYGRTVHSLAYALANFRNVTIWFTAPDNAQIPASVMQYLAAKGVRCHVNSNLPEVARQVDVLYQTRVQKERFPTEEEYHKAAGCYIVDRQLLDQMKSTSVIMHPLPRAGEITPDCDKDQRAAYFRQAENGVYVRMALLARALAATELAAASACI